jgi:kynureninase
MPADTDTDTAADDALLKYREEFPTLARSVHFVSHSLGAMPRRARVLANEFLDEWERDSIEAWHHWLPRVEETGNVIAKVLGVDAGTVSIQQNVSTVQAIVASCLDFTPKRNRVVYSSLNFHTVNYVWQETARRGAEVVVVPSRDGIHAPMEDLLAAIDERTLIVPISHVLFRSSGIKDVQAIVRRAHAVGALVLLDCYQSAGTVPLALRQWDVDMACGGSVKWICGGPGCAYLYVRPDLAAKLQPANTGWFGHKRPFAFEMGRVDYADAPAWRMANGTPPIPALFSARAGWDLINEIGVDRIRARSLRLTTYLRDMVEARGFRVNTPREDAQRGGTICFDFDGAQAVAVELNKRRFFCDYRPQSGIRASPHYYSTVGEIDAFVREVDALRARGTGGSTPAAY